jgi:photosystem II stability/assembly factor-like uncharacterized protein
MMADERWTIGRDFPIVHRSFLPLDIPRDLRMRILLVLFSCLVAELGVPWNFFDSGTKARLRGVSAVSREIAWASGSQGTVIKTTDAGQTWTKLVVPDSDKLDFRDIQAFDDRMAYVLSIGPGELSRIYKTVDGGLNWTLHHTNRDSKGFLDAIAFWDADHGLALGDPVDGHYVILATDDGGKTWSKVPDAGMPAALPGEGAFAASGTCLVVQGESNAWFGTGGGARARVFRSTDRGRTWAVADTPIRAGNPSSGVFGLAFKDARNGLAVGGDYKEEKDPAGNIAATSDGGKTWKPIPGTPPAGFRSAVAFAPGREGQAVVAVGPSDSDVSRDGGMTWETLETPGFHAIGFGGTSGSGWAVGEKGLIGRHR